MNKDKTGTIQGDTYTFGVIAVEKVGDGWMAFLHGDKAIWGSGRNLDEAIGDLWRIYHEELRTAIILQRDFGESGQTPGEMLKNHKASQSKTSATDRPQCPRCNAYMHYMEQGKVLKCPSCGYVMVSIGV